MRVFAFIEWAATIRFHASDAVLVVGVGKERRIPLGPWGCLDRQYPVARVVFEDFLPCAGGVSAVIATSMHMRDPINSGLTPGRLMVQV